MDDATIQDRTDKVVTLWFPNGVEKRFAGVTKVVHDGDWLKFTIGSREYSFKKSSLAGWALPTN